MHSSFLVIFYLATFTGTLINAEVDCPSEGITFLPDENCSLYYICANGEPSLMTCPEGFYFNPTNHECDFPSNVAECVGGTRPPQTTSSTTPATEQTTQTVPTTTNKPTETVPTSSTDKPPSDILRECGDTFVGNKGVIEYSLDELFTNQLRCAFIIRTLNHSGFLFSLEENGLIEDPQIQGGAINIFSFGAAGLMDIVNLGPPNPLNITYVTGSVVVVVFRTQGYMAKGFRLRFEATGSFKYDFVNWNDIILSGAGPLKYPLVGIYDFNLLSMFVLSINHHEVIDNRQILRLNITSVDIESCINGCTCDFLQIYSFQSNNLVSLDSGICNDNDNDELIFNTDGIFILLFKSDHSNNGDGFSLDYYLVDK